MKFRPLHDWVLIRRSKAADTTGSGIIIPDTAKDKPAKGVVEAVGPGRYKEEKGKKDEKGQKVKKFFPTVLKPGEEVMFVDYMAKDVDLDGSEITLVREDDVLGTIEQGGELAVKEPYHVEIKKDRPPMVQAEPEKPLAKDRAVKAVKTMKAGTKAAAVAEVKKPSKAKKEKPAEKKSPKSKVKKAAPAKKTAPARKAKPAKKAAVKKTVVKKTAPQKGPVKKAVPKKQAPKKPAKAVSKKTSLKKPVKTVKKTRK